MGGRAFGSLGGAVSVDRDHRTPVKTWWPQEAILTEHVDLLGNDPLDVITHAAPAGVPVIRDVENRPGLAASAAAGRDFVRQAVERSRPAVVL